ncbi:MAG TPA: hypothetical protein VKA08_03210 [Balneolales bacterium]|nr:hypothetical protein [Balneolales bacterium]
MNDLKRMGVTELDFESIEATSGGFITLIILGTIFTAEEVAAAAGAIFIAGVGAGVAAAAATD